MGNTTISDLPVASSIDSDAYFLLENLVDGERVTEKVSATDMSASFWALWDMSLAWVQTITGAKTFWSAGAVGKLKVAGNTSWSTIIDATPVAWSGTVTLPTTWTLATLAGAETLTNKILTSATITTGLTPTASDGAALGTTALMFSDLFLASGAVVNFNNWDVTLTHSANTLTLWGGDLALGANNLTMTGSIAATGSRVTKVWATDIESTNTPTVWGTALPTATSTTTLTNKRVTPRVGTVTSSATPTINTDNVDMFTITALAVAITSFTTNLSGTPTTGQKLLIRIKDNGTARAITRWASFASRGVTLPTTTVLSKTMYVGLIWNEVTSTWDCIAAVSEA